MALAIDDEVELVVVDVKTVARGYRASALINTDVVNRQDESIGTIYDLVIGRDDNVLFAIIQVGGFLGIGGRLVAVPYSALVIEKKGDWLNVVLPGATRESLERLPAFEYAT